jgi:hypothetical protein
VANSAQAANQIADIMGKKAVTVRYAARRLGEEGLIPRRSRGRSAHQVGTREVAIVTLGVMALSDTDTITAQIPELVERITKLDKGGDPSSVLMGDDQTPTAIGSFVDTMINAIGGHDDEIIGTVQCLGLQFCKGYVRAFAKWERMKDRIYFGINQLPSGMLQEVSINASVIDALREIPVKTPSSAEDGSETTEPTQVRTGSASVSSESPCELPSMHSQNMREGSEKREKNQALDSGVDSPSPNRFSYGEIQNGCDQSHRCPPFAQH